MNTFDSSTSFATLFDRSKDRWTGCDWPTRFGSAALNLSGITARQAALLARATAGQESADWQDAARWLTSIEAAAAAARQAAEKAHVAASAGDLQEALALAEQAVQFETPYHQDACWRELRNAIFEQLGARTGGEDRG
jgi:hypothetical protein